MLFEVIEGQAVYQLYLVHRGLVSTVHFSDILMVSTNPRFKSCKRIYTIDFSLFLKIKSLDMFIWVYQIAA